MLYTNWASQEPEVENDNCDDSYRICYENGIDKNDHATMNTETGEWYDINDYDVLDIICWRKGSFPYFGQSLQGVRKYKDNLSP